MLHICLAKAGIICFRSVLVILALATILGASAFYALLPQLYKNHIRDLDYSYPVIGSFTVILLCLSLCFLIGVITYRPFRHCMMEWNEEYSYLPTEYKDESASHDDRFHTITIDD